MALFTLHTRYGEQLQLDEAPAMPILKGNDCHIWIASQGKNFSTLRQYAGILSTLELNKAHRFRKTNDQELYLAAHILLRLVISNYTGIKPDKLIFSDVPGKKPALGFDMPSLEFNLSHAEGCVAIAVCQKSQVGIDIEKGRPLLEWQSIAKHYFSLAEQTALQNATPDTVTRLFYTFWTRKEAWLKAVGLGLIDELPQIDTSATTSVFSLEDIRLIHDIAHTWHLSTFLLEPDYCISLALPENVNSISTFKGNSDTIHLR